MQVRLIHVTQRRSGAKARREETLRTDRLGVGRGTDNAVHVSGLAVPLHHSLFTRAADGVYVEAVGQSTLRVNGRTTSRQLVKPGDVVRVGQTELRALAGAEDLVLEIEAVAAPASEAEQQQLSVAIGIERGLLTRRKLSWAALLLVPAVFVVLPLMARRSLPPASVSEPASSRRPSPPTPASGLARAASWIESTWNSGALSRAHSNLVGACATCHRVAYRQVDNQPCRQCHATVGGHTGPQVDRALVNDRRCTSCHLEHQGDAGLRAFGSELCVSCHADLKQVFAATQQLDVSGFSSGHPELRPFVVVDGAAARRLRVSLANLPRAQVPAEGDLQERSGLKLSHEKHLRPDLRGPAGKRVTLKCADCHLPERAGELMQPIRFAEHCQSCHPLSFDDRQPERQVPHKQPQLIESYTFEFYAALALQGEASDPSPPGLRRRPGKPLSAREHEAAMTWASNRAGQANDYLLGPKGVCVLCHTLTHSDGHVAVAPVVLVPAPGAERWLPLATFDHAAHTTVPCNDCHAAARAQSAGVVILPGIDVCRKCHGDRGAAEEVSSTCLTCHRFHQRRHASVEGAG